MNIYLGPVVWYSGDDPYYGPPEGVRGWLDLRRLPDMGSPGNTAVVGCLCWTPGTLPSEYTLLGDIGDTVTATTLSAFQSLIGYRPQGEKLTEAIFDCLVGGADPDGQSGPMPLIPDERGRMDLWLIGKVTSQRFKWGSHKHTNKVRTVLRKQFAQLYDDAKSGKLNDPEHHRRVLDFWCIKYGVLQWAEFVPPNLQAHVPGRLKHQTTLSDNFNRANNVNIDTGASFDWTQTLGSTPMKVISNAAVPGTAIETGVRMRADSDLSTSDMEAAVDVPTIDTNTSRLGSANIRFASAADTCYRVALFGSTGSSVLRIDKVVTGTTTQLQTDTVTLSGSRTIKCRAASSTISSHYNGGQVASITDSSIAGNVRAGIGANGSDVPTVILDNFVAADYSASGNRRRRLLMSI